MILYDKIKDRIRKTDNSLKKQKKFMYGTLFGQAIMFGAVLYTDHYDFGVDCRQRKILFEDSYVYVPHLNEGYVVSVSPQDKMDTILSYACIGGEHTLLTITFTSEIIQILH